MFFKKAEIKFNNLGTFFEKVVLTVLRGKLCTQLRVRGLQSLQSLLKRFVDRLHSHFQKKGILRSPMCLTYATPNQSALESTDSSASSGGSNFQVQLLGADLVTFETAELP